MGNKGSAAGGRRSDLSEWQRSESDEPALTGEGTAGHRNRVDWQAIKTEYITTDTSYRKLAQKYGVTYNNIGIRSRKEGWPELRNQHNAKTMTKAMNAIASQQASRAARLQTAADKLLTKVERFVDESEELLTDTSTMRDISRILLDIKNVQMIKSDADMREQEARIEKLRREAGPEKSADVPKLVVEGLPEEFKV